MAFLYLFQGCAMAGKTVYGLDVTENTNPPTLPVEKSPSWNKGLNGDPANIKHFSGKDGDKSLDIIYNTNANPPKMTVTISDPSNPAFQGHDIAAIINLKPDGSNYGIQGWAFRDAGTNGSFTPATGSLSDERYKGIADTIKAIVNDAKTSGLTADASATALTKPKPAAPAFGQ